MKFVTAFILLCCVAPFANAQSFSMVKDQATKFYIATPDESWDDHVYHIHVQNTSSSLVPMRLRIDESKKMASHRQRFCIGLACYGSGTTETDDQGEVKMQPGMIDSSLKMEFNPGTEYGVSPITYSFYNPTNSFDQLDVVVEYHVGLPASVEPEQSGKYMSTAMPNPADNMASIRYTLPDNVQTATIEIRDVLGNLVNSMTVSGQQGLAIINTSALATGSYVSALVINGAPVSLQRFVVAR